MARMPPIALMGAMLFVTLQCAPVQAQYACTAELGAPPCEGAVDPGSTPAAGTASAHVGNPFDAVSGNKYQAETDFRGLASPLAFVRHYNSALIDRDDGLGRGWRHGYAVELGRIAGGGYRVRQADGRAIDFAARPVSDANPRRHPAPEASDGWLEVGERHVWVLPDGRRFEFEGPLIASIRYADGRSLSIERDGARVLAVFDEQGRRIDFAYATGEPGLPRYGEPVQVPSGHLEALVLPNGERIDYRYDASLQLVSVTDAAGRGVRYGYVRDDVPGLLASVDENGNGRVSRWRYEGDMAVEWLDPSSGDGVVVAARESTGFGTGTLEVHRSDGDVDLLSWAPDADRPLRPHVERRRVTGVSRHAELAELVALPSAADDSSASGTGANAGANTGETDGPKLIETEHTVRRSGRPVRVRAWADRFGTLHDIGFRGRRASDVARELASGTTGRCAGTRRGACLQEARAFVDLAGALLDEAAVPPPLARRGRQHLPDGPACPLPAYVDCAVLAHQREMAMLSSCAYDEGACSTGYRRVPASELGLKAVDMSFGSFHAELFEEPGTGRYVLAFRGSDNGGDWFDNGMNGIGLSSDQYARSVTLADRVSRELGHSRPGHELELTGHSLGGGLATLAAVTIDRPATIFNAAAVHPDTARANGQDLANAGYLVDAVRVNGEPVSRGQRLGGAVQFLTEQLFGSRDHVFVGDVPGQHHDIPQPDEAWILGRMASTGSGRNLALHSVDGVIRSLELLHEAHCTP